MSRFPDREKSTDPSHWASIAHLPKTTTIIDWRHEICHFLQLDPTSSDKEVFEELQIVSENIKEAELVKHESAIPQGLLRYQVIHRVFCADAEERVMYLEQPWTVQAGRYSSHLRGSLQVNNVGLYLERNKEVCFLVLRDYACCRERFRPTTRSRAEKETHIALVSEHIELVSDELRSKLATLGDVACKGIPHPNFGRVGDDADDMSRDLDDDYDECGEYNSRDNSGVLYPYLWFYHRRQKIAEAIEQLEGIDQEHLNIFCGYIKNRMSDEWAAVDNLISEGKITAEYVRYIYVSLLTRPVVLASDRCRSQERLSSPHPKVAPKPSYRLMWLQTG